MQPASAEQRSTQANSSSHRALRSLLRFIGLRLFFGLTVLLAIIYLTHWGLALAHLSEFRPAAAPASKFWPGTVQAFHETVNYLVNFVQGDLGKTAPGTIGAGRLSVSDLLPRLAARSLGLLGVSLLFAVAIGVPLGTWTAVRRRKRSSVLLLVASIAGISMPSFFAALFLQLAAIQYTKQFGQNLLPVGGFGWDAHLILPALVLAARPVAAITRMTFVALSEVLDQDYIRTAHSKGLREQVVLWVHAFRNAAIPILTTIAVSLRFSLSSLPVVEIYFGWGGIGHVLRNALIFGDRATTTALFLTLGVLFILVELILEISFSWIDPRLRESHETTTNYREGASLSQSLREFWEDLRFLLVENPLVSWLKEQIDRLKDRTHQEGSGDAAQTSDAESLGSDSPWRAWRRGLVGNIPLLIGLPIVSGLIFLTIYGPQLAPNSPNTINIIGNVDGVLSKPPFPPSELYPLGTDEIGRDLLSLILAGAQQTIILVLFVVLARLLLGLILGVLAGWFNGGLLDRLIQGLIQVIAVFPILLLTALLILILGIQKGMGTFIIALSIVGWGEIMQQVRSEVMSIQAKPFIESAVAVGQRTPRLILTHVIPGLMPALISIAALEAGAVLILLGELGFLKIYIQGGSGIDLGLYSQVPEWGALLSNIRSWTRAYPWTGFYPMAAFFIAVLGFNMLGEGIRRLVDEVGIIMNRLFNRYTFGIAVLFVAAFFWARGNTGDIAVYRIQTQEFDGQKAMQTIEELSAPEFEGRALGSSGADAAAQYIADQFKLLDISPAGEANTYFQTVSRAFTPIEAVPILQIDPTQNPPAFQEDFTIHPGPAGSFGTGKGELRFLGFGAEIRLNEMDLSQNVVMILEDTYLQALSGLDCQGVLIVAEDFLQVHRRYTYQMDAPEPGCGQNTPVFWITEQFANRLLEGLDRDVASLKNETLALGLQAEIDLSTGIQVSMVVPEQPQRHVEMNNVLGYIGGISETADNRLVIVVAQYDTPPIDARGVFPAANDNASGVAVLLESVRAMRASGYQPLKSILFVAYSGEGIPDGSAAPPPLSYLDAKVGFNDAFIVESVIYLRGLGDGQENVLAIWSEEKSDLSKTIAQAAQLTNVETRYIRAAAPIYLPTQANLVDAQSDGLEKVGISRLDWERSARLPRDVASFMKEEGIELAGEAITLALMILGR